MKLKVCKFQKKQVDDCVYLLAKIKGDCPAKTWKKLKQVCNDAVVQTLQPALEPEE